MHQIKLETFVWLARLGRFRAVAERMNATQAAISQRIASLEKDLGVKLFERSSRSVKMTPKGQELLPYAEKIVDLSAEMFLRVAETRTYHGTIRLGVVETLVQVWLHKLLQKVRETYPDVTIELIVDTSLTLRDYLRKGSLDLAMLLGPETEFGIVKHPVCTYPLAWVASPSLGLSDKTITLAELARLPIITFPRRSLPYNMIKDLFRGPDLPPVRLNASGSLSTTIRLTVDGFGVSAIPPMAIQRELDEGLLHIFKTNFDLPDLHYIAIHPASPLNPVASIIAGMAREVAAEASRGRAGRS
jgi:DNA-binding transcriptional LysR family regulator